MQMEQVFSQYVDVPLSVGQFQEITQNIQLYGIFTSSDLYGRYFWTETRDSEESVKKYIEPYYKIGRNVDGLYRCRPRYSVHEYVKTLAESHNLLCEMTPLMHKNTVIIITKPANSTYHTIIANHVIISPPEKTCQDVMVNAMKHDIRNIIYVDDPPVDYMMKMLATQPEYIRKIPDNQRTQQMFELLKTNHPEYAVLCCPHLHDEDIWKRAMTNDDKKILPETFNTADMWEYLVSNRIRRAEKCPPQYLRQWMFDRGEFAGKSLVCGWNKYVTEISEIFANIPPEWQTEEMCILACKSGAGVNLVADPVLRETISNWMFK